MGKPSSSALELYARIAAMIGPEGAARWLGKPNRHMGDRRPIDLLSTHFGGERVECLVASLEGGAYL